LVGLVGKPTADQGGGWERYIVYDEDVYYLRRWIRHQFG
jgi:hypothetical protein